MKYKRIKMEFQNYKDRFYREILVAKDLNLVYLGCIMCTCIGAEFEHLFLFNKNRTSYVPDAFLDNSDVYGWLPMKEYMLDDLGDNFTFTYDTGDGWCFNCKVSKKEVDKDDKALAFLLDGKGQGIWEDNIGSLYQYLDGEVDPDSCDEDEDSGLYLPWNFENEKYSDFENYDLEFEQICFEDMYLLNINTYLQDAHDHGYELEVDIIGDEYYQDQFEETTKDHNPYLHSHIMNAVDEQIKSVEYVRDAFERLKNKYGIDEAKRKIAVVLTEEIYTVLKENRPSDEDEYRRKIERIE